MKSLFKIGCGGLMILFAIIVIAAIMTGGKEATTSRQTSQKTPVVEQKRELTKAQYEALQTGMTADQVAELLGTPGEEQSSSQVNAGAFSSSAVVRSYKGEGFMPGTIIVTYSDGKLMSKSQFGLK